MGVRPIFWREGPPTWRSGRTQACDEHFEELAQALEAAGCTVLGRSAETEP